MADSDLYKSQRCASMDSRRTSLPPCSLETIPEAVTLDDGRMYWPLMISCYQLNADSECRNHRVGQMDLSLIQVPDLANTVSPMPLTLEKYPQVVLDPSTSSGILDGKWCTLPSPVGNDSNGNKLGWCFASAHSTGEIQIHSVRITDNSASMSFFEEGQADEQLHVTTAHTPPPPGVAVEFMGQSRPPMLKMKDSTAIHSNPLCLSLAWDSSAAYKRTYPTSGGISSDLPRLVSTYSDGRVALHDVVLDLTDDNKNIVSIIERDCWEAHTLFADNPAEVWSACFVDRNAVWSGGDEGKIKVWDVRAPSRPMQMMKAFDAGVTCLSSHPIMENIVAVGSCTL